MGQTFKFILYLPVLLTLCCHHQTVMARPKSDVPEPYQGSAPIKFRPELLFEASSESAASPPTLNQFPYYPPSRGDQSPDGDPPRAANAQKQRDLGDPDDDYEPQRPSVAYVVPPEPGDLPPPPPPDQPREGRQGNSVLIGLIYQTFRVPEEMLAQMDKGSWSRADDSIMDNLPFPVVAGETYISANYYYYYYYYDDDDDDDDYDVDENEDQYDYEEYDDEFYYDDEECDDCDEEEQNRPLEPNEEFSIITFFKK